MILLFIGFFILIVVGVAALTSGLWLVGVLANTVIYFFAFIFVFVCLWRKAKREKAALEAARGTTDAD